MGEILSGSLQLTIDKIHDAVGRVDDEYIRSILGFLELMDDVRDMDLGPLQASQNDLRGGLGVGEAGVRRACAGEPEGNVVPHAKPQ